MLQLHRVNYLQPRALKLITGVEHASERVSTSSALVKVAYCRGCVLERIGLRHEHHHYSMARGNGLRWVS